MFTIPFVFAIYPELLLIKQAVVDPASGQLIQGYDGSVDIGWLLFLIARLAMALYLVASALAAYDRKALNAVEIAIRLLLAIVILAKPIEIFCIGIAAGSLVIAFHAFRNRKVVPV